MDSTLGWTQIISVFCVKKLAFSKGQCATSGGLHVCCHRISNRPGRIIGSFEPHELPEAQVSQFGVILKASQPGKWQLIVDLSSPKGHSINDGIPPELCSLSYTISRPGCGKNIKASARSPTSKGWCRACVQEHTRSSRWQDFVSDEMEWKLYIHEDTVLPFG